MRKTKSVNLEIGRRIQQAREEAGYTQERLSELLDVTPNHLSAIERGVSGISIETLIRLCAVLGISSDSILMGFRESEPELARYARQLSMIDPGFRPQIKSIVAALLEITDRG